MQGSHLVIDQKDTRWLFSHPEGKSSVRAIGVDPGIASTGFGVVESLHRGGKACAWGTIQTDSHDSTPLRLTVIYTTLKRLLAEWEPGLLVLEDVFVLKQFPKAAIQLGEVRGIIYLAAEERNLPVLQVKATEVKSAVTGSGRAEKAQVKRMIQRLLKIEGSLSSSHAADALALALTGLSRNDTFRW